MQYSSINFQKGKKTLRITKEMVKLISKKLVNSLLDEKIIIFTEEPSRLEEIIDHIITDDLMVEDRLNEEVKTIIASHENEMDSGNVDYGRMFQMIKKKLVRERNLIL